MYILFYLYFELYREITIEKGKMEQGSLKKIM